MLKYLGNLLRAGNLHIVESGSTPYCEIRNNSNPEQAMQRTLSYKNRECLPMAGTKSFQPIEEVVKYTRLI